MHSFSVIMPYWERLDVARETIACWRKVEPLAEIIVVDDGSVIPAVILSDSCRVVTLPAKTVPKTPTLPYNVGVMVAANDIIVLSGCDIRPRGPTLEALAIELLNGAEYAQAAVWCAETRSWHCHSSARTEYFPRGLGPNFCSMMRREFYWDIGGMDPAFRDGQAFDDTDFAMRVVESGARIVQCDNLICDHVKAGATTKWPLGAHARNRKIFMEKWPA